jgi:transposase InsO family protein
VENQTCNNMKVLRYSNEGEYTYKNFDSFCKEARIKMELIVPYNLQQNGVIERNHKSIVETMKAMVHDLDLLMFLLTRACNTISYIRETCVFTGY